MKQNLLNKLWLRVGMIVAIMTTALTASAADITILPSDGTAVESSNYTITKNPISVAVTASTLTSDQMRVFKNQTITISSETATITGITLTCTATGTNKYGPGSLTGTGYTAGTGYTGTWSGSASSITLTASNNQARITEIVVTYTSAGSSAVATPVISGEESFLTSTEVSIACGTEGAAIVYSTDNGTSWSSYSAPFTLTETTTVQAKATKSGMDDSEVASKIFTKATVMTVAEARAAIDAGTGTQGVYATGIVTAIPTAWSTQYNNITFNFVDAEGDTDFLQAFRCKSTTTADASTVAVGDIVVVYGNLKKYNSTYEFDQNCELVSLTKPAVSVEAPTFTPIAGTYSEAQNVTISCETEGVTIYYTTDGTEPTTASQVYSTAIAVSETTTIKAIAVKGTDQSTVATATYHICSATAPYTVAQALAFSEYPAYNVYVHGIVSTAPTQTPTTNGELTYYISDDGEATSQLEVYKGKGLEQAAFTAQTDIQVGDIVTIFGNVQVYGSTIEFGTGNYLVSFERPDGPSDPVIVAENATIPYDVTYYELMYSIENPIEGTELEATTDASWITSVTPSTKSFDRVMIECEANDGTEARTATITLIYGEVSKEVTLTQEAYAAPVEDYVTLPYSWAGGAKADLLDETGVTANGLGNDYAESHGLYRVKFDNDGDYIQFKTNERPGVVTVGVKMIGGANSSSITVQESADGETFTDLQSLSISGSTNSILTLKTTTAFAEDSRFVRLSFAKGSGSNVGVGPISIAQYGEIVVDDYILSIANPDNAIITVTYDDVVLQNGENEEVTEGTEVTVALTVAEGYVLEEVTATGEEEGQTVTLSPGEADGVYTFTMPAFNVTIDATVVEHVETVTADYVLATSITSGKRYVIASGTEGTVQVMGEQRNNNRGVVEASITNGVLSVEAENEFVIESAATEDVSGFSIYDEDAEGYLYAASSSANHLKTQSTLDANGVWGITFEEDGSVSIVAQGANTRNVMQFNSGSSLFSCYGSATQSPVYLFEKVEEAPYVQTVTVTEVGYATMVADVHLEIPADVPVEVYAVQVNGNYATLIPVTGGIPYAAAVIVKASAGEYNFTMADELQSEIEVNDLVGSFEDVVADGTQYVLANGANGVGFYQAIPGSTIKAGKAYLVVTSGVKAFYGFEDDATSIKDLNDLKDSKDVIYNVAGQRLQKMQRGINIVGGKAILR